MELEQILDLTISAKNECHAVRGYSPNQWAFGQNPQRLESFLQSDDQLTIQSSRMHDLEFEELLQRRNKARMIFMERDARRRVQRASLYRSRRDQEFSIGQLVYFFRRGRGHGKRYESRWFGPGKVVCVEKQGISSEDGGLTDGSIIWIAHGTTLYRCAPEQLRLVTHDVHRLHDLFGRSRNPSEILQEARNSQRYHDISNEVRDMSPEDDIHEEDPDETTELLRLSGPHEIAGPARYRLGVKSHPAQLHRAPNVLQPPDVGQEAPSRDEGRDSESASLGRNDRALQEDVLGGPGQHQVGRWEVQRSNLQDGPGGGPRLRGLAPATSREESSFPSSLPLRREVGTAAREEVQGRPERGEAGEASASGHTTRERQLPSHGDSRFQRRGRGDDRSLPAVSDQAQEDFRTFAQLRRQHHDRRHEGDDSRHPDSAARHGEVEHDGGQPAAAQRADPRSPHDFAESHPGSGAPLVSSGRSVGQIPSEEVSQPRSRSRSRGLSLSVNFEDELPSPILITSEEFEAYETPEPSRSLASISECSVGCAPQIVKNHDNPDVNLGCFDWMKSHSHQDATSNPILYTSPGDECVEIVLTVQPRDIHVKKDKGSSRWVLNPKPKRNAEVYMKKLSEVEKEEMRTAMKSEINSFLEKDAIEIASRAGVDPQKLLGMRWVLTYKPVLDEAGAKTGQKPKARLIIRGYEDPNLLNLRRDSPTLSMHSRNLLLSLVSINHWELCCGDVKTAFLNGDQVPPEEQLFGDPPVEAREILGMKDDEVLRIMKVIYGLLNAPRAWMDKLSKVLEEHGWIRSRLEPCVWRLYEQEKLVGVLGCHVDDLLVGGSGRWYDSRISLLRSSFPFGSWQSAKEECLTFCGCEIKQQSNFDVLCSQDRYSWTIDEIPLSRKRQADLNASANQQEVRNLRAALGALSWRATQTCPWLAASVSTLQGTQTCPLVKDLVETNKLIRTQKHWSDVPIRFSAQIKRPVLISYSDASWACRRDESSQGGQLSVLADASTLDGKPSCFSPISWQSRKLPRIARSSTSAEVQMASHTTDVHEFLKQLLIEWQNKDPVLLHDPDFCMRQFPSVLILDCKNLYDAMSRIETSGLQLEEKRTAIEVLSIRERTKHTNILVKWVDSDQQLADNLSKPLKYDHLQEVLKKGSLSIVFDPDFVSAKKKRAAQWQRKAVPSKISSLPGLLQEKEKERMQNEEESVIAATKC